MFTTNIKIVPLEVACGAGLVDSKTNLYDDLLKPVLSGDRSWVGEKCLDSQEKWEGGV